MAPQRADPISQSPSSAALETAADELLNELMPRRQSDFANASSAEKEAWRQRHHQALATLAIAGFQTVKDTAAAAERYIAARSKWNSQLMRLADGVLYQWDEIEAEL